MDTHPDPVQPDPFLDVLTGMQKQLFFYALQLTENRENARDLVQETSFKALKNRKKLYSNKYTGAWLYTILRNTHINDLRSSHRKQLVIDSDVIHSTVKPRIEAMDETPETLLLRKEFHETLNRLPLSYKRPLLLFLSGHSYKEIAREMNIPIGTVKSRIHLGKKRIRKIFAA